MKKLFKIILLISIFYSNICLAEVVTTNDYKEIVNRLQKIDQHSLVVFDIDDTILMPTDEFNFKHPIRKKLLSELKTKYTKEEQNIIKSVIFTKRKVQLVEPHILSVIKDLEVRKIPTIALTAWWTGPFGKVAKMEDVRFSDLAQVGVSFARASPFKEEMIFPEFKNKGGIPIIKSGVILTALADKGNVLKKALQTAKLSYKDIVFIDDNLEYIESVKKMCKEEKIGFLGIHYTAANLFPLPKLDQQREELRQKILKTEHKYLTDKELEIRIKNN